MASTNIQSFSGDVTVTSNLTVDATTFHVDSVAGRIGIGKTDPAFAFDVGGIVNATSFYLGGSELQGGKWSSDASDIYYTTGAVGIGTNSPAKTLEVQGTLRLSNTTTGATSDLTMKNTWGSNTKLVATDPYSSNWLGKCVAASNDATYVISGAFYKDGTFSREGAAYIFTRTDSTWSNGLKIVSPSPGQDDQFGYSVAISGDGVYAIVGAHYDTVSFTNQGSAYVFKRTGTSWDNGQLLVASDPALYDYFGQSVGISGDGMYACVGAYNKTGSVNGQGAAFIFNRTGTNSWSTPTKIVPSDAILSGYFGLEINISSDGNYVIVGADQSRRDINGTTAYNVGGAYIFNRTGTNTWDNGVTLLPTDSSGQDYFGSGVAISDDGMYAIVGARNKTVFNTTGRGAAYIFKRTGTNSWDNGTKIVASDGTYQDQFGYSVAISSDGTYAIVGAVNNDNPILNCGAAYIFTRTGSTWDAGSRFYVSNLTQGEFFGRSVSISGDGTYVFVGAQYSDATYTNQGAVYVCTNDFNRVTSTIPITADGTALSFTGQHMCFPDGPMSQGQIVSANKNKYITLNGPLTTGAQAIKSSESLPVVCLSNVANDKNVFGVVDHHENSGTTRVQESGIGIVTQEKEWGDNRVIVNSIGEGAMWVTNTNGNLVSGNYITSSNIAGYGQKQHDNKLHSYTVAKITMDCNFEPEDIPIQVIKKDVEGNNVLDTNGRIQWEDTDRTEKAYHIRYLTTDGQRTDQANAVWTAAYVGCTYHCG